MIGAMRSRVALLWLTLLGTPGCTAGSHVVDSRRDEPDAQARPDASAAPDASAPLLGMQFTEVAEEAGLSYRQAPRGTESGCDDQAVARPCAFTAVHMSGGAAAGDVDGDGLFDLYVTRIDAPGILYRNLGGGHFEDADRTLRVAERVTVGTARPSPISITTATRICTSPTYSSGVTSCSSMKEIGSSRARSRVERASPRRIATTASASPSATTTATATSICTRPSGSNSQAGRRPSHARLLRNRGGEAPAFFEDVTTHAGVDLTSGPRGTRTASLRPSATSMTTVARLVVTGDFNTSHLYWNEGDGTFIDGTMLLARRHRSQRHGRGLRRL